MKRLEVGIETGDSDDDEGRCSERDVAERGDGTRMKPKPIIFHFRRRWGGDGRFTRQSINALGQSYGGCFHRMMGGKRMQKGGVNCWLSLLVEKCPVDRRGPMVLSDVSRCFRAEKLCGSVLRNHIRPDIDSLRADEVPRAILFTE
jgi:hypothetical protein